MNHPRASARRPREHINLKNIKIMHFPIIELKDKRVPKDERMSDSEFYDDYCVNYYTDYVGDEYTESERRDLFRHG